MSLPEIDQNQGLGHEVFELIRLRYADIAAEKFNFQQGEMVAAKAIIKSEELSQHLQQLLQLFLNHTIENGYCYFKLRELQTCSETSIRQIISEQCRLLSEKKSEINKINHLIVMREVLLSKLQNKFDLSKQIQEFIDDIRFINEQIIKGIRTWKAKLQQRGLKGQPIVYLYRNQNYLTKMIIDNVKILENLASKQEHFLRAPNPFFLYSNRIDETVSAKNINQMLEILSQEKAMELRMMIQSPFVKVSKSSALENQLILLRNRMEDHKVDKIKTIYQSQQEPKQPKQESTFLQLHSDKIDLMTLKNETSIKNLEKLIKIKEIEVLKELNKKRNHSFVRKSEDSSAREGKGQPYLSKIHSLRAEVQKNIKFNAEKERKKERLPKSESQIKTPKPKIKIISEKESLFNSAVKSVEAKIDENKSKLMRSKSSFYKKQEKQRNDLNSQREKQQGNRNMISSIYSSSSLTSRRQTSSIRFNIKRSTSSRKAERQKSKSREEELNQVKESLAIINHRIREQTIKNIYSNKSNKVLSNDKQSRVVMQKVSIEDSKIEQIEAMSTNDAILSSFQDKIKNKERNIEELKQRLTQLKASTNEERQHPVQQNAIEQLQANESIQKERQTLQAENLRIKEQMKREELKFLALKEKQYQLREAELQQKYQIQLEKIKEELNNKNKEWEMKIAEDQKKQKESESKIQEIKKKSELLAFELQQKDIKEKLMAEIDREEQLRQQRQLLAKEQRKKAEQLMETIKKEQQGHKLELERRAVQSFEAEKLKLNELFLSMKKKNEVLYAENMKRYQELQILQAQNKKELEISAKIQVEIKEKQQANNLKQYLSNESPIEGLSLQHQIQSEELEIEQLKERVKLELIQEIQKKRKQQEIQERQYEEQRKRQIAEMQEELRRVMKLEEEGLENIEEEYRLKNEQIVKDFEQQLIRNQAEKQRMMEESERALKNLEHSEPFQVQKLISEETGLEKDHHLNRGISSLSVYELQKEKSEFFVEQKKNDEVKQEQEQGQGQNLTQLKEQKLKEEQLQKSIPNQDLNNRPTQKIQNPKEVAQKSSNLAQQNLDPIVQQKVTLTVKQNSQQIREKYDLLLERVSKPIKQIFMPYDEIDSYLTKYYNQLSHEVKEMLPYSRKQLQSIFREKKVDVFDGFNFGLYRPKDRKFTLFGSVECVPLIASKYGQIQVQQIYLFNKGNNYQKQYLSKQIKLYEKIGYIFQKKTNEEGIYTIKFIIKIPKDIKKQVNLKDQLEIKAILRFEEHQKTDVNLVRSNCLYYMLGRGLSEILSETQKVELSKQTDMESKYISRKLNDPSLNNTIVKTEVINHNIVELNIFLPIKYIQTSDQPYFTLEVAQYVIKETEEKLYVANFQQTSVAVVIHQMRSADVPEGFSMQSYIESKFKKMEKTADLFLFLPVWESSHKSYYKGNTSKSFSYMQRSHANLIYGSIVKSKVHKGDFIFLEPPFAFLLFEVTSAEVMKRILFGSVVQPEEVLRMKRVTN